jgi:hypothetical protein
MLKQWRNLNVLPTGLFYIDTELKHQFPFSKKYKRNKKTNEITWDGYYYIKFPNSPKYFPVHRIMAELYIENPCPGFFKIVDHINRCRTDNSISNLRYVNAHLNAINKPPIGIKYRRFRKGWVSRLSCRRKKIRIGVFNTFNLAYAAAVQGKKNLFDEQYKKYLAIYKKKHETPCVQKKAAA